MIKGKIATFTAKDIHVIAPDLDTRNFTDISPYYDACEEVLLDDGFELWDDDIVFNKEILINGVYEKRYNIAVVRGIKRKERFILQEIGISYKHIHDSKMNDLEKLIRALNSFRPQSETDAEARKLLDEVIEKMRRAKKKNV